MIVSLVFIYVYTKFFPFLTSFYSKGYFVPLNPCPIYHQSFYCFYTIYFFFFMNYLNLCLRQWVSSFDSSYLPTILPSPHPCSPYLTNPPFSSKSSLFYSHPTYIYACMKFFGYLSFITHFILPSFLIVLLLSCQTWSHLFFSNCYTFALSTKNKTFHCMYTPHFLYSFLGDYILP